MSVLATPDWKNTRFNAQFSFSLPSPGYHEGLCTDTEKAGVKSVIEIPRIGLLVHERKRTGATWVSPGFCTK